jgi:hypothetical protein
MSSPVRRVRLLRDAIAATGEYNRMIDYSGFGAEACGG